MPDLEREIDELLRASSALFVAVIDFKNGKDRSAQLAAMRICMLHAERAVMSADKKLNANKHLR